MTKLRELEKQVRALSPQDFAKLRVSFAAAAADALKENAMPLRTLAAWQKALEKEATALPPESLAILLERLAEFDAALWDKQIERDAHAGAFDDLAQQARAQHAKGESTPL